MGKVPRPVLIMNGVLAGLGVILAGAALTEYLSVKLVGLLLLIHSGVSVGWGIVTQQSVRPEETVAAYRDPAGQLRAGEASPVPNDSPVDVTAVGPSPYDQP